MESVPFLLLSDHCETEQPAANSNYNTYESDGYARYVRALSIAPNSQVSHRFARYQADLFWLSG